MRPRTSTSSQERSLADTVELGLTAVLVLVVIIALLEIMGVHIGAHR